MQNTNLPWWKYHLVVGHLFIFSIVQSSLVVGVINSYMDLMKSSKENVSWFSICLFIFLGLAVTTLGFTFYIQWSKKLVQRIGMLKVQMENLQLGEKIACSIPSSEVPHIQISNEVDHIQRDLLLAHQTLQRRSQKLEKIFQNRDEIEHDLHIACQIQLSVVPQKFPAFPEHKEFDIYAFLLPAKEMGGDLYDFFLLDEDHLVFSIGDVSDKGLASALLMAVTNTFIKAKSRPGLTSSEVLAMTNYEIGHHNPSCMFVTIFMGILEISTGKVEYTLAGHNRPYILRKDGKVEMISVKTDIAIGAEVDWTYRSHELILEPGEMLFMYTDGVTEAMNHHGKLYEEMRLECLLKAHREATPHSLIYAIYQDIRAYVGSAPQSDDITMLALRYVGDSEGGLFSL